MDDLPFVIIGYIFHYLDAFDAHRFGLAHQRAFQVIRSEREQNKLIKSHYNRWFDDVDKRIVVLIKKWTKVYAEDPDAEYAPSVQHDIQQCDDWGDELWELITGTYEYGDDLDLEGFAINIVEAYELVVTESCSGLHQCIVCGLRNTQLHMTWEGAGGGYRIFDQHSQPKCLQCAYV